MSKSATKFKVRALNLLSTRVSSERYGVFPKQRRDKILAILESAGFATVDDLASKFDVSADSIRRDLKILADSGLCHREYGGAFRVRDATKHASDHVEPTPIDGLVGLDGDDDLLGDEGRMAVAQRAYMEINDGDAIFLDISKTNLYLADIIAGGDKRLIVTTNMLEIPKRLASNPKVTAFSTGGYLNAQLTGFIGSATISLLEPLLFAKAFIGCSGVNVSTKAVLTDNMDDGMVKQKVLGNAYYKFLLADKNKFCNLDGYRFSSINDFTAVITDESDPDLLRSIVATGTPALCC